MTTLPPGTRVVVTSGPLFRFWPGAEGTVIAIRPSLLNGAEFAAAMDNGLTWCLTTDEVTVLNADGAA